MDNILTPPEVDANGNAYQTVLPDVANPTAGAAIVPDRGADGYERAIGGDQLHFRPGREQQQYRPAPGTTRQRQYAELELRLEQCRSRALTGLPPWSRKRAAPRATATRDVTVVFRELVS